MESKLEALKSKSGDKSLVNSCNRSESWGAIGKPTNELSTSSFTWENRTCTSLECQPAPLSTDETTEIKLEASHSQSSLEQRNMSRIGKLGGVLYESQVGTLRKRRGKRKRKDCNYNMDIVNKEGSIGENNLSESANPSTVSHSKENSCCNSFQSSDANEASRTSTIDGVDVLNAAFNSVAENKNASIFRRRLDSQVRMNIRYNKNMLFISLNCVVLNVSKK